jgi:hypothetical protein
LLILSDTDALNGEHFRASVSSGPGWPELSGGVLFHEVVKTAQSRDRLGAPCLHGDFCSSPGRRNQALSVTSDVAFSAKSFVS